MRGGKRSEVASLSGYDCNRLGAAARDRPDGWQRSTHSSRSTFRAACPKPDARRQELGGVTTLQPYRARVDRRSMDVKTSDSHEQAVVIGSIGIPI